MNATKTKTTKPRKDRHATPVIVTSTGQIIATKRRIEAHLKKHGTASVLLSEWHHFAMLPFLRVARDEDGNLHLCTATRCDEEGWDLVEA